MANTTFDTDDLWEMFTEKPTYAKFGDEWLTNPIPKTDYNIFAKKMYARIPIHDELLRDQQAGLGAWQRAMQQEHNALQAQMLENLQGQAQGPFTQAAAQGLGAAGEDILRNLMGALARDGQGRV